VWTNDEGRLDEPERGHRECRSGQPGKSVVEGDVCRPGAQRCRRRELRRVEHDLFKLLPTDELGDRHPHRQHQDHPAARSEDVNSGRQTICQ